MLFRCHFPLLLATSLFCMPTVPAIAQQPIGQLYATDASVKGSVMLAGSGTNVLSGSSIEAGAQAATLKLDRGGDLLVCEGTKLSITSSRTGRELLLSLNSGNLELNYPLGTEADTLLTPDLRLLLPGPGTVHIAVRVSAQGDTCVQSLPWNASAIVISESMGDATYQVKPDEAVLFKSGHLNQATKSKQNCGCPRSVPAVVAKTSLPPVPAPTQPSAASPLASAPSSSNSGTVPTQTTAAAAPPEQHLAVDAPFIFHGDDPAPDLRQNVVVLRLESRKMIALEPTVLPPPGKPRPNKQSKAPPAQTAQAAKPTSHGFFSKVGAFFASIFH